MTFYKPQSTEVMSIPDISGLYMRVHKIMNDLPSTYQPFLNSVLIRIENFAQTTILDGLALDNKYDLLGFYQGIPIPLKKLHGISTHTPDIIYLYRCPLIRFSLQYEENLNALIQKVLIHELRHHINYQR